MNVRDYDFFKAENICIIDRKDPKISVDFLKTSFVPVDDATYSKYAIEGWLKEVLDI